MGGGRLTMQAVCHHRQHSGVTPSHFLMLVIILAQ
jgi:hypothetical protein